MLWQCPWTLYKTWCLFVRNQDVYFGYGKHEIHLGRKGMTIKKPLGSDGGNGHWEVSSIVENWSHPVFQKRGGLCLFPKFRKKKAEQKQNKPHNHCFASLSVVLGKTQQVFNSQIILGQVFKECLGFVCSRVFKPSPSSAWGGAWGLEGRHRWASLIYCPT